MQHPGIPAEPHQSGYAARHTETAVFRTLQIKTFRTGLKNHVMVMDFVKSNWFPSQRRAKVCIIHMYQGLKTAEQTAGRYEIHSRLFSSPNDHSAWERNESLANAGLRDNQYSTNDRIALKTLQPDVTEKKSDFAKEPLASQNTKMISSIVISQLIDKSQSKGTGVALPVPCALAQPHTCPTRPSLLNGGEVTADRALEVLPGRLGIQTQAGARGPETEPPPKEKPCSGPQKGFASITITARRVRPPASTLVWGAVGNPPCAKCRAQHARLRDPSAPASGAAPCGHDGPLACTEFSRSSSVVGLKLPETHAPLCEGRECWVSTVDQGQDRFPAGTPQPGKSPLVFSSCVHLRVSQKCPNSIYCLDRSLSVPLQPPQLAGPKMHRSVLSLNLNCSSHGLTPEGVGGTANRGPLSSAPELKLTEGSRHLLGPGWNPGVQAGFFQENPPLGRVHLGAGTCPWSGAPRVESTDFADGGRHQVMVRRGKEDQATGCHTSLHAKQLSIHIPGWSYTAVETKVFSGGSKKQQEARVTLSAPPVGQKLGTDFLPDAHSSPSNDCQSSGPSEPTESQQQGCLASSTLSPGSLCPLRDVRPSAQEGRGAQIERASPRGDYTCCDLVVKIKECKQSEDATVASPPSAPTATPSQEPDAPGPQEDCSKCQQTRASALTLQEALEARNPQFISRSRERLRNLERRVRQRRAQPKEDAGQRPALLPVRAGKKQCTVPHPLSDNLFKPKERLISEKEMHMRSKRIYNNLPEVKKKKEEQKKRVILQSNRLRAEVFKKQLLDQLLQRNAV